MDSREILGHLKSKLPSYMLPYGIKLMHGFPLTVNNKTDRKALKYEESETTDTAIRRKRHFLSPTEEKIFKIWSEILRIREIGRNDNFFDLGGNSLLAISLLNRMEEQLGVNISFKDLIINSSIADLGKYVDENCTVT